MQILTKAVHALNEIILMLLEGRNVPGQCSAVGGGREAGADV